MPKVQGKSTQEGVGSWGEIITSTEASHIASWLGRWLEGAVAAFYFFL